MRHQIRITAITLAAIGGMLVENRAAAQPPLVRRLAQQAREALDTQPLPPPLPTPPVAAAHGRPRIGVVVEDVTAEAIRRNQLAVRRGALITTIEPGSAADQAGLPIGGVIVSFDGVRIDSPGELTSIVRSARPGQVVEIGYYEGPRLYRKRLNLSPPLRPSAGPIESTQHFENLPLPPGTAATPSDRPFLDRLGRALNGIVPPQVGMPAVSGPPPSIPADSELTRLRQQVELLESQIQQLTERLAELESRLDEI